MQSIWKNSQTHYLTPISRGVERALGLNPRQKHQPAAHNQKGLKQKWECPYCGIMKVGIEAHIANEHPERSHATMRGRIIGCGRSQSMRRNG